MKTKTAPHHWWGRRLLPKNMTEPRTVKNFLVVVTMEQGRGPNSETHLKMKNYKDKQGFTSQLCYDLPVTWPRALATEKLASCHRIAGCL